MRPKESPRIADVWVWDHLTSPTLPRSFATMTAYIQTDAATGWPFNVNAFNAAEGFATLGYEIRTFRSLDEIDRCDPEPIIVGGIGNVRRRLSDLGLPTPPDLDYPEPLRPYLGRRLWEADFREVLRDESLRGIFIKPRGLTKYFTGKVVDSYADLLGLVEGMERFDVWCSAPVRFVAEYRCYIRYGELWDVRPYKGHKWLGLDDGLIREAAAAFFGAPAAYGLDFGITDDGRQLLVEVNDGYSLGSYGMSPVRYARFLAARWADLTGTEDWCRF